MNDFSMNVIKLVRSIPSGKVATYGQIAELAGKPGAARGVSWILHSSSTRYKLPWHRVINAAGKISFPKEASNFRLQRKRLEAEGIEFRSLSELDLVKYQWKKNAPVSKNGPSLFNQRNQKSRSRK